MLLATPNEPVPLHALAANGQTDLYGVARVYDSVGALVSTVTLSHMTEGLYGANYTPTVQGVFTVVYQLYLDSGHTSPADFDKEIETIDVSDERTNIMRILGLMHENAVFDQQAYNGVGNLISGRVRAYNNKPNAEAAGLAGLLFTWNIQAIYNANNQLVNFMIKREA